jgi:hypothetical protein
MISELFCANLHEPVAVVGWISSRKAYTTVSVNFLKGVLLCLYYAIANVNIATLGCPETASARVSLTFSKWRCLLYNSNSS